MSDFDFARKELTTRDNAKLSYYSLAALDQEIGGVSGLPVSLKILLESLLRLQAHPAYTPEHVRSFTQWTPDIEAQDEYPFMPSRVLLQDFTGVPCVVDLAALRSALARMGKDPGLIEPRLRVDLIIDHSIQTDRAGSADALEFNMRREFERNDERYRFLKWGQQAFGRLHVHPPGLGIIHQVNMESLASCVRVEDGVVFPDTLVGTDSHTVMINSMGILGWGVGGIEAEAAMLGQPIPLVTPRVTGVRLFSALRPGALATDIALYVTQLLREKGVVGRFVEFFGQGCKKLSLTDRAPIANMGPEYGATMGFFGIDEATLEYLRQTGRDESLIDLVERYCKEQGLWRGDEDIAGQFTDVVEVDLGQVEPSLAGPHRPQERIPLPSLGAVFADGLARPKDRKGFGVAGADRGKSVALPGKGTLSHGSVVIASITSCTNTATPSLMLSAGLMARKAVARGLRVPATVKTSLAPGSRVVTQYLRNTGLLADLEQLGFHVVSYGCASCIGNSGPLDPDIDKAIRENDLVVAAVLSGNRNFEGRIHPLTRANYLASPPLVLAFALKGSVCTDLENEPIASAGDGQPVYLRDLWPTPDEIRELLDQAADPALYRQVYEHEAELNPIWNALPTEQAPVFPWEVDSTYIREPSFFEDMGMTPTEPDDIRDAAVLGLFGDFITTDHISPAGAIPADSPAAAYLRKHGVDPADFNSFGSRRGNHEVMLRATFGNIRIRNLLVDHEGGWTLFQPTGEKLSMYDAAVRYHEQGTPLVVLAGKMYGAGSSRDWAAKGAYLLGVKAVIAESFERIHRSNLVEMGVLPCEFTDGANAESLGLTGRERMTIHGIGEGLQPSKVVDVSARRDQDEPIWFKVKIRVDTPVEVDYYIHGGILQYVLREMAK